MRKKQESKTDRVKGEEEDEDEWSEPVWRTWILPIKLQGMAKYCPLIAAILAPLATLLDIPALTVSSHPDCTKNINSSRRSSNTGTRNMASLNLIRRPASLFLPYPSHSTSSPTPSSSSVSPRRKLGGGDMPPAVHSSCGFSRQESPWPT